MHINLLKIYPEKITREDEKFANDLDFDEIEFPVREKDFSKIETKNSIYCLQLIKASHIMCISNILTDLSFTKQRTKTKNTFAKIVYSALVVKMLTKYKEDYLKLVCFKNYFKSSI